ncbi:hypothetical protein L6452_20407 [Arctium lappa]|uniref:Uncharacterized protein n=1 Tax=Arctium lappa TaxID=4217 RepID=A0ACB9BAS3_ARCLA|nr:hypothetical protein L6452_20407 [Arctium lappa]
MEQKKHICIRDELATLSSDYPWLVAHNLDPEEDDTGDQVFYRLHDPMSHYRCRIPQLVGRRIRGCFDGWMILSKRNPQDIEWSLWNPVISKLIPLPRMILKDDGHFRYCCLSSPPDDPGSMLLLIRSQKPNVVFVFCNGKRRKTLSRRWTEISYSEQIKNIIDYRYPVILLEPTCCNGNIYAFTYAPSPRPPVLIQVQITVVEKKQPVINLVPLGNLPWPDWKTFHQDLMFLKGSCTQLFSIRVCLNYEYKPCDVYLYKLDMSSMVWTEIKDLKDTVFFVSLADYDINDDLVYSTPPIASELGGGYVHILEETGDEIHSYNIKDKTISMSSTRCLGLPICKRISTWTIPRLHGKVKCNLHGDHDHQLVRSAKATNDDDDDDVDDDRVEVEQKNEAPLLNIPFDVLEYIFKFCVGIEYLNFRATCKLCRLAAPMQTYSSASPWLVALDKDRGIITFTDPMSGHNNYLIKASPELFYRDNRILCSRHGWLLLYIADRLIAFFNPFTKSDIIRKLPFPVPLSGLEISFSFSAPPTSPDCMVVAFVKQNTSEVYFHRVGGEPSWYMVQLDVENPHNHFEFPTFCGEDVYTLSGCGAVDVFRGIDDRDNFSRNMVVDSNDEISRSVSATYYQVKCDQHHLLVIVDEYGESVEVFKLNDCTREWEEIDGLGRHMIYICDTSCVCMDAKIPEMENKIYFPRLHSKNEKLMFYSLETCRFFDSGVLLLRILIRGGYYWYWDSFRLALYVL